MSIYATIDGIPGVYGYGPDPGDVAGWETNLAEVPDLSADRVDPEDGQYTGARLRLSISASATTRRRLLHQAVEAVTTLASGVGTGTTGITLSSALPSVPTALFMGNETLRIVSQTTPTSYVVERGSYNSTAQAHATGTGVYIASPWWRRRVVRLWQDGVQVWVGMLDVAPYTSSSGTRIEIEAAHVLTLGSDMTVGQGREARVITGGEIPNSEYLTWPLDQVFALPSGMPSGITSPVPEPFRVGDCLTFFAGDYTKAALPSSDDFEWYADLGGWDAPNFAQLDSPRPDITTNLTVQPVLAIGGELLYPTPFHVVEVVGNLLFSDGSMPSTYDAVEFNVFPRRWSAQLRWATDDDAIAEMRALIDLYPEMTVDRLVLGWDGQPVPILEVCRELLLPYGLVLCSTATGAITVRRLEAANVRTEAAWVQPYRDTIKWTQPAVGATDEVRAQYGAVPWDDGTSRSVRVDDFDAVRGESVEMNIRHISPIKASLHGQTELISIAMRRWRGTPLLEVQCSDAVPIGMLDHIRLRAHQTLVTEVFPLPDLTETNDVEREEFIGQVISRRWIPATGNYQLDVHLSAWPLGGLLRLRAPALEVDSAGVGSITVIENSGWGAAEEGLEWPSYDVPVELWTADGDRISAAGVGVADYYDSGSTTLYMTTDFLTTPSAGNIIRLARGAEGTLALDPREYVILLTGEDRYR